MPLLYHSFQPQGEYLWALYCRQNGIQALYEIKLNLYTALLNHDLDSVIAQTHGIMDAAIENLPFYGA